MMESILRALSMAFAMGWEILWPLILGFALSAVVQAVVSHREMVRLLPDDRPRSIATALALGARLDALLVDLLIAWGNVAGEMDLQAMHEALARQFIMRSLRQ